MANRCGAHAKSTGKPCTRPVADGATRCRFHGGAARQVKVKAAERVTEAKARRELGRLAAVAGPAEPVQDPLGALSSLAGEVLRFKDILAGHVAELERLRYTGENGEQIQGEVQLFERALDRCATVLTAMARLNIDERLAQIEQAKAEVVVKAFAAGMAEAGVSGDALVRAKTAVSRHLRLAA